jgi:hypothetical protein
VSKTESVFPSRSRDAREQVTNIDALDLRLALPLVTACLLVNMFGVHGTTGTWLAVLVCIYFVAAAARQYGIVSVPTVVLLTTLLYGAAPAHDLLRDLGSSFIDGTTYVEKFLPILTLYLAAFLFGCKFGHATFRGFSPSSLPGRWQPERISEATWSRYALLGCMTLAYAYAAIARYGIVGGEFSRAEIYQGENLDLQVIRAGIVYGVMLGFVGLRSPLTDGSALPKALLWSMAFLTFVYVDILILGDRRILLSTLVALVIAAQPRVVTLLWIGLIAAPAIAFLWVYSFLRDIPLEDWSLIVSQLDWELVLNIANGEFGGWTRIAADIFSLPFHEVWRLTLFEMPLSVIPSWLYPDRPLAPSLWYVNTFDPQTADILGGWGFSLPIEGYINAGLPGAAAIGLIAGAIVGFLSARRGMFEMSAALIFCFSFRADSTSLVQQGILIAAFAILYRPAVLLGRQR